MVTILPSKRHDDEGPLLRKKCLPSQERRRNRERSPIKLGTATRFGIAGKFMAHIRRVQMAHGNVRRSEFLRTSDTPHRGARRSTAPGLVVK